MVAIYLSDYVTNTLVYVIYTHGKLSYTFTNSDFPAGFRNALDMACELFCLGNIFRNLPSSSPESAECCSTSVGTWESFHTKNDQILFEADMKAAMSEGHQLRCSSAETLRG